RVGEQGAGDHAADVPVAGGAGLTWPSPPRTWIRATGEPLDGDVSARLSYLPGDLTDTGTYRHIAEAVGGATRLVSYLEVPPSLFATVVRHLAENDLIRSGRVVVEKPFGHDLASRLLLNSATTGFPHGLCNNEDQVGRYVMVQGASQTAGRWPEELRMYKGPPPEVSSEQFYETDPDRGFARGFSIQTVSPLPIGWAEHVLADGHWGRALREYMRDYNHWAAIGVLNELLPQPDNRVTLADEVDEYGLPVARFDYTLCDNDKRNMAYSTRVITDILRAGGAQDVLTIQRYAHLIGGARMGSSPQTSVVDANQRAWSVPNLFIADGSVFPTQGAANPALTIMALASRLAERMISGEAMDDD